MSLYDVICIYIIYTDFWGIHKLSFTARSSSILQKNLPMSIAF